MSLMVTIGEEEEALLMNDQVYLVKQRLSQQLVDLLGECAKALQKELADQPRNLPVEVLQSSAKISRGENYLGRPWTILDYPRIFSPSDMFAFRTLCWWGQGFSMTLLLRGRYLEQFLASMQRNADPLAKAGFYLGVAEDPFVHHFGKENILPLDHFADAGESLITQLGKCGFLKLVRLLPLTENRTLVKETVTTWNLLGQAF